MTKDLRFFLQTVEENASDQVLKVQKEVNCRFELSAVQKKLEEEGKLPVLIFEKISEQSMRVVTNLTATKRHIGLALDVPPKDVTRRFIDAQKDRRKPRLRP